MIDIILKSMTKQGYVAHSVSVCQILLVFLTWPLPAGMERSGNPVRVHGIVLFYIYLWKRFDRPC
jgi:hypothetical protein